MSRLYDIVSSVNQAVSLGFALFLIVGGSAGFYFAKSMPSLLGGSATGIILIIASLRNPRSAASRAAILLTTAFVSGFFSIRYFRTGKVFPAAFGAGAGFSVAALNLALILASAPKMSADKNKDE